METRPGKVSAISPLLRVLIFIALACAIFAVSSVAWGTYYVSSGTDSCNTLSDSSTYNLGGAGRALCDVAGVANEAGRIAASWNKNNLSNATITAYSLTFSQQSGVAYSSEMADLVVRSEGVRYPVASVSLSISSVPGRVVNTGTVSISLSDGATYSWQLETPAYSTNGATGTMFIEWDMDGDIASGGGTGDTINYYNAYATASADFTNAEEILASIGMIGLVALFLYGLGMGHHILSKV